jgi:acyl transferase domain-containing protein
MGQRLLGSDPVFAAAIARMDPLIRVESGFSPQEILANGIEQGRIDRVQPLIFAMQIALAECLRSRGVEPAAVVGHSMGEIAAAVVAGALDLRDGVRVICRRSLLSVPASAAGFGSMASVGLDAATISTDIAEYGDVEVAITAAPRSTVVAGARDSIARLVEDWSARGIVARMIAVDVAGHCYLSEPAAETLASRLTDVRPRSPHTQFYTTVLDDPRATPGFDADYWAANIRREVRAMAATMALVEDGYRVFQEISPHPVAIQPLISTLEALDVPEFTVMPTLHSKQDPTTAIDRAVAALHCAGIHVDWSRIDPGGRLADVPTMTWERRSYLISTLTRRSGPPMASNYPANRIETTAREPLPAEPAVFPSASTKTDGEGQNAVARQVTEILRGLLHLHARRVSGNAKFAQLGLDSLRAAEFRILVQQAFQIDMPEAMIWKYPTIAEFSRYLDGRLRAATQERAT